MAKNLFQGINYSKQYSLFRTVPPTSLANKIRAFLNKDKPRIAVDVGCGSGQGTLVLAPYFENVIGLDLSSSQIDEAKQQLANSKFKNVDFRVQSADKLPFEDGTVDLVSACQSVHWFDIPAFYKEADRVLSPKGVLAVIGYHLTGPAPNQEAFQELTKLRDWVFHDILSTYWDPERRIVDAGYTTLPPFLYKDFERDDSHFVETTATLQDLAGYIQTWSGFRNFKKLKGKEAADEVIQQFLSKSKNALSLSSDLPPSEIELKLRTNYFLLIGRKD